MTISVFLDANVLVPIGLTDILLRVAEDGLIDPHWSPEVLAEVAEAVARVRTQQPAEALQRRFAAMNAAFPYALTSIDPGALNQFELPDPDDRHIVAGALACETQIIVTHNIKDFPAEALSAHNIQAATPDKLLLDLFGKEPDRIISILEAAAAARNPLQTVEDVLITLELAGVRDFVKEVRARVEVLKPAWTTAGAESDATK